MASSTIRSGTFDVEGFGRTSMGKIEIWVPNSLTGLVWVPVVVVSVVILGISMGGAFQQDPEIVMWVALMKTPLVLVRDNGGKEDDESVGLGEGVRIVGGVDWPGAISLGAVGSAGVSKARIVGTLHKEEQKIIAFILMIQIKR